MVFSIVPATVTVPTVVVLKTAALAVPVPWKKALSIMTRADPVCSRVGRPGPIASVPLIVISHCVPVAV